MRLSVLLDLSGVVDNVGSVTRTYVEGKAITDELSRRPERGPGHSRTALGWLQGERGASAHDHGGMGIGGLPALNRPSSCSIVACETS